MVGLLVVIAQKRAYHDPKINMQILLTGPYIIDMIIVGRICLNIKTIFFGDHHCYSHDLFV